MPPIKKQQKEAQDTLNALLDRVDPYSDIYSTMKPWYGCICAANVQADPNALTITDLPFYIVFDLLERYYGENIVLSERSAIRAGYIPQGQIMVILPYRGRFGAGWMLATHYDNTSVVCKYCLLTDGGLNHGNKAD